MSLPHESLRIFSAHFVDRIPRIEDNLVVFGRRPLFFMEPRIAELLVRGGVVTREQLTQAQEKERDNGSSITKELVRLGITSEETLTDFLAKHFGIERVEINPAGIEDTVFSLVPPHWFRSINLFR